MSSIFQDIEFIFGSQVKEKPMNDCQIREAFHRKFLQEHHNSSTTLVVDELGLEHGMCRADIAVINELLTGYEIKSDVDSLKRLNSQIISYNSVFNFSFLILTERHMKTGMSIIPEWWGIILAGEIGENDIEFKQLRMPLSNKNTNSYSIAQLLWRDEAQDILAKLGVRGNKLRKNRELLYCDIVDLLDPLDLRLTVSKYLRKRRGWRDRALPFLNDDLSQHHGIESGFLV